MKRKATIPVPLTLDEIDFILDSLQLRAVEGKRRTRIKDQCHSIAVQIIMAALANGVSEERILGKA